MKLRIHHFFDMIRDFGIGKQFDPHPYQHSYHKVAELILTDPDFNIEIAVGSDAVCKGCRHLVNSLCNDTISHRNDFTSKEAYNNYLDTRIIEVCEVDVSKKYSPKQLVKMADRYIQNISFIYEGNDAEHTEQRKQNVILGLEHYAAKHNIS